MKYYKPKSKNENARYDFSQVLEPLNLSINGFIFIKNLLKLIFY